MATKTIEQTFKGHVMHCRDLDGGTEFNIEVMIDQNVTEEYVLIKHCENSASKNELVTMSGNTHEFEYLGPSGRIVKITKVITREELSPTDPEIEKTLGLTHLE